MTRVDTQQSNLGKDIFLYKAEIVQWSEARMGEAQCL